MIQYKCNRCGTVRSDDDMLFTIDITAPKASRYNYCGDLTLVRHVGIMHLCTDCMDKFNDFIGELGRNND